MQMKLEKTLETSASYNKIRVVFFISRFPLLRERRLPLCSVNALADFGAQLSTLCGLNVPLLASPKAVEKFLSIDKRRTKTPSIHFPTFLLPPYLAVLFLPFIWG